MWKKDESENERDRNEPEGPDAPSPRRKSPTTEPATIGPSITISGEVSGDEDLLIEGRVEGSVDLAEQSVTVGREGRVNADITGRVVTIEGEVEGDLKGGEQVILRSSAKVEGDITAPRVILEDGARFRGLVDMGEASDRKGRGKDSSPSSARKDTSSSKPSALESGGSTSSDDASSDGAGEKSDKPDLEKATS